METAIDWPARYLGHVPQILGEIAAALARGAWVRCIRDQAQAARRGRNPRSGATVIIA
jgi:hypothetical protein